MPFQLTGRHLPCHHGVLSAADEPQIERTDAKGIEVLIDSWIVRRIHQLGAEVGNNVPELVQRQIEQQIGVFGEVHPIRRWLRPYALSQRCLK